MLNMKYVSINLFLYTLYYLYITNKNSNKGNVKELRAYLFFQGYI